MGVYWRGGSLLSRVTEPGLRLKVPFLDVHSSIQVTLQTDKVSDIPCGTKGVMVTFDKVEVRVNPLTVMPYKLQLQSHTQDCASQQQ